MATQILSRSITFTKFSHSFTSHSLKTSPFSFSSFPPVRLRPLVAAATNFHYLSPGVATVRGFATRQTTSSLNDSSPNSTNRPPNKRFLLDGCDFEHWLVVLEIPEADATRDQIIYSSIKTLAAVVGSKEEARMKIYSLSTRYYYGFGALVSEELSDKLKQLPNVRRVVPDCYLDVKNKEYGGEPFINGQAVLYDPKYHAEWENNHRRAADRNRRNQERPWNFHWSRSFERRENMQQNRMVYDQQYGRPPAPMNRGGQSSNMGGGPANMGEREHGSSGGMGYQSGPGPNREYQNNYNPNMAGGNNPY